MFGRHGDIKPENILWLSTRAAKHSQRGCCKSLTLVWEDFMAMILAPRVNPDSILTSLTYAPLHPPLSCIRYLEFGMRISRVYYLGTDGRWSIRWIRRYSWTRDDWSKH
ncbi:hypothetical protein B0O99DRAFT_74753 [Bisporella sp. PMI_857]|nr:hypothetical protein B0O99DRAFT_74753 [Bisporella sp. PMI_857]